MDCLYKEHGYPYSAFSTINSGKLITLQSTSIIPLLEKKMKLAGVCIVLLALATASYATPYYEEEERANEQDVLSVLLKKLIQKKQAEAQMARYEEARSQLTDILQKLQDKQALSQQDAGEIIGTVVDTVSKLLPAVIPLATSIFG